MRIDWYTKGGLTVIAVLLGMIVIRPYVSPETVAHAQGSFAGVEYGGGGDSPQFFDTRTGEVWQYVDNNKPRHYRLTKLGAPLSVEK